MTQIGLRLKSERLRLQVNQSTFALSGGVQTNTQGKYERGQRIPNLEYLARLAQVGVDVLYVITGIRSVAQNTAINAEEQHFILKLSQLPQNEQLLVTELINALTKRRPK